MSVSRYVRLAGLGLALALTVSPVNADELRRLHEQILRDPANTELNFRYAELAEQRGELRKALVAYERVLVNDPENPDVLARLQRIRRMLQPDTTQFYAQIGAAYESNPARRPTGERDDASLIARFSMRDERGVGNGYRWRTIGQLSGEVYVGDGSLSYGYVSAYTGPLFDLTPMIAVHAALGGSAAYFDRQFFYKEATAHLTFESFLEGAFHTVRIRGGYRDYESLSSGDGVYADVTGRFTFADVFGSGANFSFVPWYRWSDLGGTGFSVLVPDEQVQPGRYHEFGAGIEFHRRLSESISIGVGFAASQRKYADGQQFDPFGFPTGPVSRRDVLLAPHATLTFHKFFSEMADLRFHYRYEHNDSTLAYRDYENHIATLLLIARY